MASDDEISLMSLSDEEKEERKEPAKPATSAALPQPGGLSKPATAAVPLPLPGGSSNKEADLLDQATLWAEVDIDELERVAVTIAQNAVIQTENSEAVSRLNITASAIETDNMDPLGFGRVDTRVLALEAARRGLRPSSPGGGLEAGDGPAGQLGELGSNLVRNKVLPASEQFDPELYLKVIHSDTTVQELSRGLHNLKLQLSEHTGQLKALVKENFERFISSKNTIDDIYAKLQKAEADGQEGVDGTSSSEVMVAVLQVLRTLLRTDVVVQDEARRAFGPLLERQSKADRIKQVLGLIRRYEAVVRLPSRVREHAQARDYEQVVADYRKARALLADHTSELPQQAQQDSMWLKLLEEIDKVVCGVAYDLEAAVRSVQSVPGEVHDAIKYLLQLQALGVRAAQGLDPARLYMESQERHIMGVLEGAQQQYRDRVAVLLQRKQESEDREEQLAALANLGITPPPSAAGPPPAAPTSAESLGKATQLATVQHVARLTAALAQWLPPVWTLTQARLPGLAGIGSAATSIERGMAEAEQAIGRVLAAYRHAVRDCFGSSGCLDAAGLLSTLRDIVAGCLEVQQAVAAEGGPAPTAAVEVMSALAEQAAKQCIAALRGELQAAVARLCEGEDWVMDVASQRAGAPVTGAVAGLRQLITTGMQHLAAALSEAGRVQVNPLRKSAAPARDAFFGCFTAYGAGLRKLAEGVTQQQQEQQKGGSGSTVSTRSAASPGETSVGRRLLLLCANANAVHGRLLGQLYRTWGPMLQAGGSPKEGQAAAAQCAAELEAVEHDLVMAYIDRKQAVLDQVMEEFFFGDGTDWESAPPPTGMRPVVLELLHTLVLVQAELSSTAPGVLGEVVAELVTSLVEGFAEILRQEGGLPPGITPGGVCQLWLEGRYLAAAVGVLSWPALAQAVKDLEKAVVQRLQSAIAAAQAGAGQGEHAASESLAQLQGWCRAARGAAAAGSSNSSVEGLVLACFDRLGALCREEVAGSAANLAPLRNLGQSAAVSLVQT
ncbi:hypothetical protein N2152v2_001782 [Parachlorella kessleri]